MSFMYPTLPGYTPLFLPYLVAVMNLQLGIFHGCRRISRLVWSSTATAADPIEDDIPEASTYRYNMCYEDNSEWVPVPRSDEASIFCLSHYPSISLLMGVLCCAVQEDHRNLEFETLRTMWQKMVISKTWSLLGSLHGSVKQSFTVSGCYRCRWVRLVSRG